MENYYQLLGLPGDATEEEIKHRCLELGQAVRPDIHGNDIASSQRFKDLERAFVTLTNPHNRASYDETIKALESRKADNYGKHERFFSIRPIRRSYLLVLFGLFVLLLSITLFGSRLYARWQIHSIGLPYSPLAFSVGVDKGNTKIVELYLKAGMNPDIPASEASNFWESTCTGLYIAALNYDLEMGKLLLNWGASPNPVCAGSRSILQLFLDGGFVKFDTILGNLSEKEKAEKRRFLIPFVELLLKNGAIPNIRDGKWFSTNQKILTREASLNLTGEDLLFSMLEASAFVWNKKLSLIDNNCSTNGLGTVSCTFRNTGISTASACVRLVLEPPNSNMVTLQSSEVCSGNIAPNDVRQISQHALFFDSHGKQATPSEGCRSEYMDDWRRLCSLAVETAVKPSLLADIAVR